MIIASLYRFDGLSLRDAFAPEIIDERSSYGI
jgi:hypothetical protein